MTASIDVESLIDTTMTVRSAGRRRQARRSLGVSAGVTVSWLIWVTAAGHWDRVGEHWASAVTMVFGSFVAGSTPQGGGAVAFPVFTKVLEVPSEVARTFSLAIQSIGMSAASLSIIITRRPVEWRGLALAAPAAITGFALGVLFLVDRSAVFGISAIPDATVKVAFTVIVAAMAFMTWLGYRNQLVERRVSLPRNGRVSAVIVGCGLLGGLASSLVGSGADVFSYLAMVSLIGLSPRVGIATSVLVMTIVSLVGVAFFAISEGHLATTLSADLATVVQVDNRVVSLDQAGLVFGAGEPAAAQRFDLFGLWLAAVPVVAWGAPLGSAVSARVTDRQVVRFVVSLAALEFISTLIFLDALRTDLALAFFGGLLLMLVLAVLWLTNRYRHRLLRLPATEVDRPITRAAVDVGPGAVQQLNKEEQ